MNEKIDFVIPWVDGNDIEWRAERRKYDNSEGDNREIRYRDWENLRYWFRGVEKYAPWVHKIFFVTWGHVPVWLETSNSKLEIIKHEDFMPREYLPTFNSNAIELNLHRIPDLSEQFVYFNDDVFVWNYVKETDFFKKSKPCDSAIMSPIIQENKNGIGTTLANNIGIINEHFNKQNQITSHINYWYNFLYGKQNLKNLLLLPWHDFCGFYEMHITSSFLKSTYNEVWEKEKEILETTSKHKFRRPNEDVNQWLMRDWQLASNNFAPRNANFGRNFNIFKETAKAIKALEGGKYKVICINDSDKIDNFENLKEKIINIMQQKLPEKCSFEK